MNIRKMISVVLAASALVSCSGAAVLAASEQQPSGDGQESAGHPVVMSEEEGQAEGNAPEEKAAEEDPITKFVTRLYDVTLGREPDDAGLADWSSKLRNKKMTGISVAFGFIFSPEFQGLELSNEDYVECMYRAFMGRKSDAAGKADWVRVLEENTRAAGREKVFLGFANSKEFDKICAEYGIVRGLYFEGSDPVKSGMTELFVERLYNVVLDRSADEDGMRNWASALMKHKNTGIKTAYGFFFSPEYLKKARTDEQYVDDLYSAFMGREGDENGRQYWLSKMKNGTSRLKIFNGFACSPEFTAICESYGIDRGAELKTAEIVKGGSKTWEETVSSKGVPADWKKKLLKDCEYWVDYEPQVTYRMGGKALESGSIDCSGFVTQLYRRALGTMAPSSSFSKFVNDSRNFSGYQDMTSRGTWYDNRGGERPRQEGIWGVASVRGGVFFVDKYGIGSPNYMDVKYWFDQLISTDVEYEYVRVVDAAKDGDWEILEHFSAGDIVIWSDSKGGFYSAGDVHIAIYDGEGGVYQSGDTYGGVSHVKIPQVLQKPLETGDKRMYIFRMSGGSSGK